MFCISSCCVKSIVAALFQSIKANFMCRVWGFLQPQAMPGQFFVISGGWHFNSKLQTNNLMAITGLVTPGGNPQPIRKRTTFMSNAAPVRTTFQGLQCQCPPGAHYAIEGSIDGISLSRWCQHYTPDLCQNIAAAVSSTVRPPQP